MKHDRLDDMIKGWFIGDFPESAYRTSDFEVAIKSYTTGEVEAAHYHKIATEITAIVSGRVRMVDQEFGAGDIVTLSPGEVTSFEAISDTMTVVVKFPSAPSDKYVEEVDPGDRNAGSGGT